MRCQDFFYYHVIDHARIGRGIDSVCSFHHVLIVVRVHSDRVIDGDDLWILNLGIVHWCHVEMQYKIDL